jgi:acetylornithine deacetylase/succinyl-diaminopimelate desuccinylase-like protein
MDQADLDALIEFLRFPSISTDSASKGHVNDCADWLIERLKRGGMDVEKHPTAGHPIVLAKNKHQAGRKTVMIYGHYDVQPVDPLELWDHPPFEPHIDGDRIYARGSTDNKGQLLAHLLGVEKTLAGGNDLPVNLTFLFEGEEEIGSPNLEPFLKQHRESLACDVVAISDTGMVAPGVPTFTYGLRGIACVEVRLYGPTTDLHSGIYGGAGANPATAVAQLAASLHNVTNGRVQIEGFYDQVIPLEEWESKAWAALPLGDKETIENTGVPSLYGEEGYTSLERTWGRPTAEVNGIAAGYQGEGSKTVIPAEAMLKLSFRLVPDQEPARLMDQVKQHLEAHLPPGITMKMESGHDGKPYKVDPHNDFGKAAQRALEQTFGKTPALIREGGSIPIVQSFKDVLDADTLLLGLALPDCRAHAPNENFSLTNFEAGILLNQNLLRSLA